MTNFGRRIYTHSTARRDSGWWGADGNAPKRATNVPLIGTLGML
jgi:hypothetical protein